MGRKEGKECGRLAENGKMSVRIVGGFAKVQPFYRGKGGPVVRRRIYAIRKPLYDATRLD
jgi:hypothetical protein